jgi:hypothetical protein
LTDIARYKDEVNTNDIVMNWLRNLNTIELWGLCELWNNRDFKPVEFDGFKKQAGLKSFLMTKKMDRIYKHNRCNFQIVKI